MGLTASSSKASRQGKKTVASSARASRGKAAGAPSDEIKGSISTFFQPKPAPTCPYVAGHQITSSYGKINYLLSGPVTGPLLVCLHGMNASLGQYELLADKLTRYRFRVLRFDFWGHALSDKPKSKGAYTPQMYVDQVFDVLLKLHLHEMPISLIGFSMGGLVAVYVSADPRFNVNRFLLISPAGLMKGKPKRVNFLQKTGCVSVPIIKASFFKCYIKREHMQDAFYDPARFEQEIDNRYDRFRYNHRRNIETTLRVLRGMPLWENYEPYRMLAALQKPVCFILGEDDDITPPEEFLDFLRSTFGSSNIIAYKGCKHLVIAEKFDSLAADALYFLLGGQPGGRQAFSGKASPQQEGVMSSPEGWRLTPVASLRTVASPAGMSPGFSLPGVSATHPEDRDKAYSVGTAGSKLVLANGTYPVYAERYTHLETMRSVQ